MLKYNRNSAKDWTSADVGKVVFQLPEGFSETFISQDSVQTALLRHLGSGCCGCPAGTGHHIAHRQSRPKHQSVVFAPVVGCFVTCVLNTTSDVPTKMCDPLDRFMPAVASFLPPTGDLLKPGQFPFFFGRHDR